MERHISRCAKETIIAFGHKNIKANHRTTFEITKEKYLTPKGDCIIGINANKSASDLSENFKSCAKRASSKLVIHLIVDGYEEIIHAEGSPRLKFVSNTSIVVRKSSYIDGRTIAINSDKSASDINREIISSLKRGHKVLLLLECVS